MRSKNTDSFRAGKFIKEATDERLAKPGLRKPILQMPCCVCSELSAEGDIRNIKEGNGSYVPEVRLAGLVGVSRRLCSAGSYPYAINDSAEVQCGPLGSYLEREVSDPEIQRLSQVNVNFTGRPFWGRGYRI